MRRRARVQVPFWRSDRCGAEAVSLAARRIFLCLHSHRDGLALLAQRGFQIVLQPRRRSRLAAFWRALWWGDGDA